MSKSLVNPEIVNNLTPFFRRRNEAQYALADAMATYQAIPGLRGLWWAGSKYNGSGVTILDLSGNGMNLSEVTVPTKPKISVDADFLAP